MRKNIPVLIVYLIGIAFLFYYLLSFYQFFTKSYYVDKTKLYQIDTFHLLSRAYLETDFRGRGRYGSSKIVFQSTNGYSFAINDNIYRSVIDKKELLDTLMYHELKFTVFSDKKTYEEYRESKKPVFIEVFQLQIGEKKYIDIPELNNISKSEVIKRILVPTLFLIFLGYFLSKKKKE